MVFGGALAWRPRIESRPRVHSAERQSPLGLACRPPRNRDNSDALSIGAGLLILSAGIDRNRRAFKRPPIARQRQARRASQTARFRDRASAATNRRPRWRVEKALVPDLEGRHVEGEQAAVCGIDVGEIHERKIAAELLVTRDAFIIVQEIAAAVKDETFS